MATANRLLKLSNPLLVPLPSANGNHPAPLAPEGKDTAPVISFGSMLGDFIPINGSGGTLDVSPRMLLSWYRLSELAYSCMAFRAQKLSEPRLWITEENDGEESWLPSTLKHPMAGLLTRPNLDMRLRAFLWLSSLYLDATGRCLWVKVRGRRGGLVTELRPFSNDDVLQIEKSGGRMFGRFQVQTADGPQWYGAEDVVHFADMDPADPMKVVSPLMVASRRLGIDKSLAESIRRAILQVVVPGAVITYEGLSLTADQRDEIKASLQAGYAGALNRGKAFILENATFEQNDLGFKGLEGGKLAEETEARVCMAFGIPPVIMGAPIGLKNSSDRHNLETSRDLFYENVVVPRWTQIEDGWTDDLLPEFDTASDRRFVRFDRSKVKAFQEDVAEKIGAAKEAEGFLSLDEQRALAGYSEATPEQREEIAARKRSAVPQPRAEGGDAEDESTSSGKSERKSALSDDVRRAVHIAVTESQEFGWQMAATEQLQTDRAALLRLASETLKAGPVPAERKDAPPFGPADPASVRALIKQIASHLDMESAEQWRRRMTPLTQATARRAVERASAELGISFDLLQPGLLEYVEEHAAELVTQVTETTREAIRAALAEGLLEGEGIPELTKRIQGAGAFSPSRAELIARTETVAVTNGAQVQSMSRWAAETGGTVTKRWLTANDGRVRPAHRTLNGEVRGIDEAFSNGLQHPGEPNCRCTTVMELEAA